MVILLIRAKSLQGIVTGILQSCVGTGNLRRGGDSVTAAGVTKPIEVGVVGRSLPAWIKGDRRFHHNSRHNGLARDDGLLAIVHVFYYGGDAEYVR